ncbi:AtpZ/AtpI family protein [Thermalbibacter longus]|uniref:AtpZ/AtpI family protein n=2 Tax=Thermorudis TaxID=1649508 RepID=A0A7C2ZWM0_9BACT|nr:AtpZ/AtpI family protein [Thermalbibacter longus]
MSGSGKRPLGTRRDWQTVGAATGLGCSVVTSLILCIGGGVLLDQWLGTEPVLTLIGVVLGLASAGYLLYELAVINQPEKGLLRRRRPASREDREAR